MYVRHVQGGIMDHIVTHWQEVISLIIVAITAALWIRSVVVSRKRKNCERCILGEIQRGPEHIFNNK